MTENEHPKNPVEAHREGLDEIEHKPHHPTTHHDKPPHPPLPPMEPPGQKHRDGDLPNLKR